MEPGWIPMVLVFLKTFTCYTEACEYNCTKRKEILDRLLDDRRYDASIAPDYEADIPTNVTVQLWILTIHSVRESSMDFSADVFLRQTWKDTRLKFLNTSVNNTLELDSKLMEKVWVPDIYFSNEKEAKVHDVTVPNKLMHLRPDGSVFYSIRISLTLTCEMYLHKYPLDSQECSFEIESYSYTIDNVNFFWNTETNAVQRPKTDTSQFEIDTIQIEKCAKNYGERKFAYLRASMKLTRNMGYYLVQIFVPSVLIVSLSWVSFWLDMEAVPARISLGVLTVLTMTTQSSGARESLPRVSYVKAIDVWMAVCLFFVFAALLEFAYVNVLQRRYSKSDKIYTRPKEQASLQLKPDHENEEGCRCWNNYFVCDFRKRARKIDKRSRVLFPSTFIIFNIGSNPVGYRVCFKQTSFPEWSHPGLACEKAVGCSRCSTDTHYAN
ncbi:hypothetical protein ScPMuIL_010339, partial [Solemya velum]